MSVRVSAEDAAFIAGLDIPGASTPSDKLRSIIIEARQRREDAQDFGDAVRRAEDLIQRGRSRVRDLEHRHRVHSELVSLTGDWLGEAAALLMTFPPEDRARPAKPAASQEQRKELVELERRLADKLFALIESVLRLGVTRQCRCYDGNVVADRLGPSLEIARLIEAATTKAKEA
ncbi:MAG: hypothetical protein WD079_02645 [Phycisphaeraceae bacterium]